MTPQQRDAQALVARRLRELVARDGAIPPSVIRETATALGISTRTIYRHVYEGRIPSGERPHYDATDRDVGALFESNGNYRRAYDLLAGEGVDLPSRSTFRRALKRRLRPDERAFAKYGEEGRRRHQLYLTWQPQHRNEVWETDHKVLDLWIHPDHRSRELVRPSVIQFLDGCTRAIVGYTLSLTHTADDALAALRNAVLLDPEIGPFCGVPQVVRFDNGLEFLSDAFTDALGIIGTQPWATDPYTPYQKGKVERVNRTLSEEFCATLPYATATPRSANRKQPYAPAGEPVPIERLAQEFRRYVNDYNTARAHSALGGATPKERWESDPTPLRQVAHSEVRWLLKRRAVRKIGKDGIHFQGEVFFATEFNGLARERVEIAFDICDLRSIDVYRDDTFLCTAVPHHHLSADDRVRFLAARRQDRKNASNERRKASRRQGLRYREAGLAGPGAPHRTAANKPRASRTVTAAAGRAPSPLLRLDRYDEEDVDA